MPIFSPTLCDAPNRAAASRRVCRVIVVLGGIKSLLLRYFLRLLNVIVIVADNAKEIEALRRTHYGKNFITFVLGEGQTTRSLHAGSNEQVRAASELTANSSTEDGLGARAVNAKRAAEITVESKEFQDFLKRLPDMVSVLCGGIVSHVGFELCGSLSGAVFSGARKVIADAVLASLLRLTVPVDVRFNVLGSTTFAGLSDRARQNYGYGLLACLADVLNCRDARQVLVSKYLELHELRPSLDDNGERDQSLIQDTVASDCREMDQYLSLLSSNYSNNDQFGNIRSRCVDFMRGLNPKRDIASLIAHHLRLQVEDLLGTIFPDPLLVDEVIWEDQSVPQERLELPAILDRLEVENCESLMQAISKASAQHRFQINMLTAHGVEIVPEHLATTFALTPHQIDEFIRQLRLTRTFQQMLHREYAPVSAALQDVEGSISKLHRRFEILHTKLITGRYWFPKRLLKALADLVDLLRENFDRRHLLYAEQQALSRAITATDKERLHHDHTVERIQTALDAYVPRGSMTEVPRFVVSLPLESVFSELLTIADIPPREQVELLCSCASTVNADGLARIVGSSSNRLEKIAEQIVYGDYDIQSPGNGGSIPAKTDKVVYAIPPLRPQLEEALRLQIAAIHPTAKVIFTDTLVFGATVMKIRSQRFTQIQELFAGRLAFDVADAVMDPRAALNSTDNFQALKDLNGRIEHGRIVFDEPEANSGRNESPRSGGSHSNDYHQASDNS